MKNLKFHVIAIAAIIIVVTALYSVIGPQKAPVTAAHTSGHAIEIYSATWGEACNPAITDAMATRARTPAAKDDAGQTLPIEPLQPVKPNNVLITVGDTCNGKTACTLRADSPSLALDPLTTCFKRLVVHYRCYSVDRLHTRDIGQGEILTIDCLNPNAADAADTNAH